MESKSTVAAAIVDPYSSGALLAPEFTARGIPCIAVQSTAAAPAVFQSSLEPAGYAGVLVHGGDPVRTASELKRRGVQYVIAGCELGVALADELSERLGLPTNGVEGSPARRDKFLMAERVRECGLRVPSQFASGSRSELLDWAQRHSNWPVIVKPLKSSSSDGVSLCDSAVEVGEACESIMRSANVLDEVNEAVLIQEFLEGAEYIVDTVSCEGLHRIAAFWEYGKPRSESSFVCYDSMLLLPSEGERQRALFEYASRMLDALGIRYGPAHCELMWVGGAPLLVEMGARLSAGNNCLINRLCSGVCQLDLTVEAYLDRDRFFAETNRPYELAKTAANVFLMPQAEGVLRGAPRLRELEDLESLHELHIGLEMGQPAPRVAGVVTLLHADLAVVTRDLERIRYLERHGLFEIDEGS